MQTKTKINLVVGDNGDWSVGISASHFEITVTIDDELDADLLNDLTYYLKDFFKKWLTDATGAYTYTKEEYEKLCSEGPAVIEGDE